MVIGFEAVTKEVEVAGCGRYNNYTAVCACVCRLRDPQNRENEIKERREKKDQRCRERK